MILNPVSMDFSLPTSTLYALATQENNRPTDPVIVHDLQVVHMECPCVQTLNPTDDKCLLIYIYSGLFLLLFNKQ